MEDIQININGTGKGAFQLIRKDKPVAEMAVGIQGDVLTVYHTEVNEALQGQGLASALFSKMLAYAQEHRLKVDPKCSYVRARFQKDPEKYKHIWLIN